MSEEQHGFDALNQNKVIKYNSMQIITKQEICSFEKIKTKLKGKSLF